MIQNDVMASTEQDKLMGKFSYSWMIKHSGSGSKSSCDGLATAVILNPFNLHNRVAASKLPTETGLGFPNHGWDLFATMLANPVQNQPHWQFNSNGI